MLQQSVRPTETDLERMVDIYGNMLFRICFVILCNQYDAEDAVQDTFIKYLTKSPTFRDVEHEKAWLITVATNHCKNKRRFNFMHKHLNISDLQLFSKNEENYGLLDLLMKLPDKHKIVLLLYYVEGYRIEEVATILSITPSAVKKRLQRGRELIRERYRKEKE
ncbi:RNA polymerase sigma factor [Bacillus sp. FJAT-29814]|uniref:RNA polymerase sigma factor n=1 Tax=Bacillus sp. FJAT-29814 TaxID=1729688 RepID=UPI00082D3B4F|nr:RNA polymerase sigma factor [Bacillus sp. FJAT-29814]